MMHVLEKNNAAPATAHTGQGSPPTPVPTTHHHHHEMEHIIKESLKAGAGVASPTPATPSFRAPVPPTSAPTTHHHLSNHHHHSSDSVPTDSHSEVQVPEPEHTMSPPGFDYEKVLRHAPDLHGLDIHASPSPTVHIAHHKVIGGEGGEVDEGGAMTLYEVSGIAGLIVLCCGLYSRFCAGEDRCCRVFGSGV